MYQHVRIDNAEVRLDLRVGTDVRAGREGTGELFLFYGNKNKMEILKQFNFELDTYKGFVYFVALFSFNHHVIFAAFSGIWK